MQDRTIVLLLLFLFLALIAAMVARPPCATASKLSSSSDPDPDPPQNSLRPPSCTQNIESVLEYLKLQLNATNPRPTDYQNRWTALNNRLIWQFCQGSTDRHMTYFAHTGQDTWIIKCSFQGDKPTWTMEQGKFCP